MQTKLLTTKEVAERLSVSANTVTNWARGYYYTTHGPRATEIAFIKPVKVGKSVRFKESELNRWLESRPARLP